MIPLLTCPEGSEWVRERQQRPPVVEAAPVVMAWVETEGNRTDIWRLGAGQHVLVCAYSDGSEARVIVEGPVRVPEVRKDVKRR